MSIKDKRLTWLLSLSLVILLLAASLTDLLMSPPAVAAAELIFLCNRTDEWAQRETEKFVNDKLISVNVYIEDYYMETHYVYYVVSLKSLVKLTSFSLDSFPRKG